MRHLCIVAAVGGAQRPPLLTQQNKLNKDDFNLTRFQNKAAAQMEVVGFNVFLPPVFVFIVGSGLSFYSSINSLGLNMCESATTKEAPSSCFGALWLCAHIRNNSFTVRDSKQKEFLQSCSRTDFSRRSCLTLPRTSVTFRGRPVNHPCPTVHVWTGSRKSEKFGKFVAQIRRDDQQCTSETTNTRV